MPLHVIYIFLTSVSYEVVDDSIIRIANLTIFPERYEAVIGEKPLQITKKQFDLLLYLAKNKGLVLSREQLLEAIWDYDFDGVTRIVDVHISHLREKIEPNPKNPFFIQTIHGYRYKMVSTD